jgi:hypothetical protein
MIKSSPVHFKLYEQKRISDKKSERSVSVPYSEDADNMDRDPSIHHINQSVVSPTFVRGLGVNVEDL